MSTWIEIPETLLSEACSQLDPMPRKTGQTTAVNSALVTALLEYFEEGLDGCDHSVNICQCALADLVNELRMILNGEQTCPMCMGDTCLWSAEKAAAEKKRLAYQYGESAFDYDTDSLGMYDCPACSRTGKVTL